MDYLLAHPFLAFSSVHVGPHFGCHQGFYVRKTGTVPDNVERFACLFRLTLFIQGLSLFQKHIGITVYDEVCGIGIVFGRIAVRHKEFPHIAACVRP